MLSLKMMEIITSVIFILFISNIVIGDDDLDEFYATDRKTDYLRVKRENKNVSNISLPVLSNYCEFNLPNISHQNCPFTINSTQYGLHPWKIGIGKRSIWIGGPTSDADGHTDKNGYAVTHMKELIRSNSSAILLTLPMPHTKSKGICLSFKYVTEGLSLRKLEIAMLINFTYCINNNTLDVCKNKTKTSTYSSVPLWVTTDSTYGNWETKEISYSYQDQYRLAFIATANRRLKDYSSYVAVDNIKLSTGSCGNDCQFDQDFCHWKIPSTKTNFQWKISRSSTNYGYGPSRDQSSSLYPNILAGGFAYVENAYPRRAGDKARLISKNISYSDMPMCMRFWTFMTGKNVATLKILKQDNSGVITEIWSKAPKNGDYGWGPCQITLSDSNVTNLTIIIEAEINQLSHGEIAIDSITFEKESCPVEPAIAGKRMSNLDCSFDVSSCFWKWIQPKMRSKTVSIPMLAKVSGNNGRPNGHSWNPMKSDDSYIVWQLGSYVHHARDSAYLVSPTLLGRNEELCLSFWGIMHTHVPTDTSIGALSVVMALGEENITLWRLSNKQYSSWFRAHVPVKANQPFQLIIKGTKGCKRSGIIAIDDVSFYPHKCKCQPEEANVFPLDCSFDDNACKWKLEHLLNKRHNTTDGWRYPGENFGQTVVYDHTYEIANGGFVYVYLESQKQDYSSWLVSPIIKSNDTKCFTFFVSPLSKDDKATLTVYRRNITNGLKRLWNVSKHALPSKMIGNNEDKWIYAQTQFEAPNSQIVIEAKMKSGGWAIDDIRILSGPCETRPNFATITNNTEFIQSYKTKKIVVPTTIKTKPNLSSKAKIRVVKSPTPSVFVPDDMDSIKGLVPANIKTDPIKPIKASEHSGLLPPTEMDGPHYPQLRKSDFEIPETKKHVLG